MRRAGQVAIGVVVLLTVALYAGFAMCERQRYLAMIPASIETSGSIRIGGETHFRRGCGVAVFRLSERASILALRQGLTFFELARQERSNTSGYPDYEPWRETPIVERSESNAIVLGVACASLKPSLEQQIEAAAEHPGSFFTTTTGGRRKLLVSPASRLVVLAYWE